MSAKYRVDELLFLQKLAPSREVAKRLIMAGKVAMAHPRYKDKLEEGEHLEEKLQSIPSEYLLRLDKPGHKIPEDSFLILTGIERFVSRGAYKLLTALEHFNITVKDFICLDAGASTGGFTDCLLQHGAKKVYALDVGHKQLHEKLLADPRVISMEGCNIRTLPKEAIADEIDLLVADVSFISLRQILPHCTIFLGESAKLIVLVKPQFELDAKHNKKGVVRDPTLQQEAVRLVQDFCEKELSLYCHGVVPSHIKGPKGNQEYLMYLQKKPL